MNRLVSLNLALLVVIDRSSIIFTREMSKIMAFAAKTCSWAANVVAEVPANI